ncbi:MAG: peptidoglycan D,D-transpeptidase FtsI family protein, partial [Gemmatimonadaceae bacterium]
MQRSAIAGRIGRPTRTGIIHASLAAFAVALVVRSAYLQIWQGDDWEKKALRQHFVTEDVPAARGDIFDASLAPLAQSREMVGLSVAPSELADRRAAARALAKLGVSKQWIARATDRRRAWVTLPGRFLPGDAGPLAEMRGVYARAVFERVYTQRKATRRVIGSVDASGAAIDGLELVLDTLLRGRAGTATLVRDAKGLRFQAPPDTAIAPRPGDNIVLTINQELQEISEEALARAAETMGAEGGDIVILDPHTGEIRAMASRRLNPRSSGSPALSEPFEPGSTLKPFIATALLELQRATVDETVNTENGTYIMEGRRNPITDTHKAESLTLEQVIRYSSNIGIVKLVQRLTPREEFETLRDFGFGTPTGVPFPSEAGGILRAPRNWSRTSAASLAMGYEIAVTALQLASAYATFANGGELLEPALIREVRSATGEVKFRHERRVVRRVMGEKTARAVREMLVGTVEAGTATRAGLGTFALAGKTGTARRTAHGRYVANEYTASFVGLFPANEPQYVILVKLDNPKGEYYGGLTAAPVTKAVLEAAIAARDAALDRRSLARVESVHRQVALGDVAPATSEQASLDVAYNGAGSVPYVLT